MRAHLSTRSLVVGISAAISRREGQRSIRSRTEVMLMMANRNGRKVHLSTDGETSMDEKSIQAHGHAMKAAIASKLMSPEMRPNRVGERIRALREVLELKKVELADALQYDHSSMTKVEKGDKGLDIAVAVRLSDLYGVGLDYIYRGAMTDLPVDLRTRIQSKLFEIRSTSLEPSKEPELE